MTLAPSASLRLGNLLYETHLVDVTAMLRALPGVDAVEAILPAAAGVDAAPGDPGSLALDGGEGSHAVITGTIRAIRRDPASTRVSVADAGADLAALRPAATYERRNAKDVVRSLAGDANAQVGTIDLDVPLPSYVADQRRTAAEHVAYLAGLAGATAAVGGDGALTVAAPAGARADVALRFGRELIEYEVRAAPAPAAQQVVGGFGPAGSAEAPDALRHSLDHLPASAASPGAGAVWRPAAVLRTPTAANIASEAATKRAAAEATALRARCFLLPQLRPGLVLEVQDLPDGLAEGPWLVTWVFHRLSPDAGAYTLVEGISADVGGGLLGAGLSALGGLL